MIAAILSRKLSLSFRNKLMIKIFNKLKLKWGITSDWQVVTILIAFSLAGPTVIFIKGWYFDLLAFNDQTPTFVKTIAYLVFIFPAYQVILLIYGFLLGQFRFFWEKGALRGRAAQEGPPRRRRRHGKTPLKQDEWTVPCPWRSPGCREP